MFIEKELTATIDFINSFQQEVELLGLPFTSRTGKLYIKDSDLFIDFQLTTEDTIKNIDTIIIGQFSVKKNNGDKYVTSVNNLLSGTINLSSSNLELQNLHISTTQLMSERWKENVKYYYRILMPIENVFWINDIETCYYKTNNNIHMGIISINIDEDKIQIYPVYIGEKKYIAIESETKCTYKKMKDYIYSISLSLGLITSVIPFDYSYIIATETSGFQDDLICGFVKLRPTVKGQYIFFTTNMYDIENTLIRNNVEYAKKQLYDDNKKLKANLQNWILVSEFEKIVQKLYGNEDLARATLILIESSNMSLDYQGAMLAVVLETICSALDKSDNKNFMKNDDWAKKVRNPFEELINNLMNKNIITEEHATNMKNKLNSLNLPSNKDKLSLPFSQNNYQLTDQEKKIINTRNNFLHGHILGNSYAESFQEIMYASFELQKLCALLLFRESGFKGLIVNNAVLMGLKKAIEAKEPVLI